MVTKNKSVQVIFYPDCFGGNLEGLYRIINKHLSKWVKALHILPFYPSNADRGFSPLTHLEVDKSFGTNEDIKKIAKKLHLTADLVVNHISSDSVYFKDYLKKGESSKYADYFITARKFARRFEGKNLFYKYLESFFTIVRNMDIFFHKYGVSKLALRKIYRPRHQSPFVKYKLGNGSHRYVWCTFSEHQIDLNMNNKGVRSMIVKNIDHLSKLGVDTLRLDAVAYAGKKRGTNSFLIADTLDFIKWLAGLCHERGMHVLPEVHFDYSAQIALSKLKGVDYVYDFALPFLTLNALFTGSNKYLNNWVKIRPHNCVTTLDTHDGIGVVDVKGLIPEEEIKKTSQMMYLQGGNAVKRASGTSSKNVDTYQINCTYYSVLGCNDDAYIAARAIQFFLPGIPQVYYVGLLAGENDTELLEKTGIGRDVNRHFYSEDEVVKNLKRKVVKRLLDLIEFRNSHKAFSGEFSSLPCKDCCLRFRWDKKNHFVELDVDLKNYKSVISYSDGSKKKRKKL